MKLIHPIACAMLAGCLMAAGAGLQDGKDTGANLPAQAAADVLKTAAGADGAFIASGMLKADYDKTQDLASTLLYPEDQLTLVKLTGKQVKLALERSVSLYPQPNTSFLQLSGFEATFNRNLSDGKRILTVLVNGSALSPTSTYLVAMPSRLAEGGYGYFKIWDKPNIVKTIPNLTLGAALKGKPYTDSSPRWHVVSSPPAQHGV